MNNCTSKSSSFGEVLVVLVDSNTLAQCSSYILVVFDKKSFAIKERWIAMVVDTIPFTHVMQVKPIISFFEDRMIGQWRCAAIIIYYDSGRRFFIQFSRIPFDRVLCILFPYRSRTLRSYLFFPFGPPTRPGLCLFHCHILCCTKCEIYYFIVIVKSYGDVHRSLW